MTEETPIPLSPFEKKLTLASGREVVLRPSTTEDGPALERLANTFSERTFYHILFKSARTHTATRIERYTANDYPRRFTLVACGEQSGGATRPSEIVGVSHFWQIEPDLANLTIVVGDRWQRSGIGKVLLTHLVEIARRAGFRRLRVFYTADNHAMRALVEGCGFVPHAIPGDDGSWEIKLDESAAGR